MAPNEKRHGPEVVAGPCLDSASAAINGLAAGVIGVVQALAVELAPYCT
jgi:hypothetical protein